MKVSPSFTSMHSCPSTWKPNCRMSMNAFSLGDQFHLGMAQQDLLDAGGVIRLQMVDQQVVQLAAIQRYARFSKSWRRADQSTVSKSTVFSSSRQ